MVRFGKTAADQAPPDFVRGLKVFVSVTPRGFGEQGGFLRGEITKQLASDLRVIRGIAGAASGAGSKDRPLCKMGVVHSGGGEQTVDLHGAGTAGVGARQAGTTPQVTAPRVRKSPNGISNRIGIGAAYKPQAAAQALIEGPQSVIPQAFGPVGSVRIIEPMEIAFVEAIAIESQPAQNRIEA
jgi:hypothetical protein